MGQFFFFLLLPFFSLGRSTLSHHYFFFLNSLLKISRSQMGTTYGIKVKRNCGNTGNFKTGGAAKGLILRNIQGRQFVFKETRHHLFLTDATLLCENFKSIPIKRSRSHFTNLSGRQNMLLPFSGMMLQVKYIIIPLLMYGDKSICKAKKSWTILISKR